MHTWYLGRIFVLDDTDKKAFFSGAGVQATMESDNLNHGKNDQIEDEALNNGTI